MISLEDTDSKRGTIQRNIGEFLKPGNTEYGYTVDIRNHVSWSGKGHLLKSKEVEEGWGYGMYAGRPIIGRDTRINGGVYPVGGKSGEALVIDDLKNPEEYEKIRTKLTERLSKQSEASIANKGLRLAINRILGRPEVMADLDTEGKLKEVFSLVSKTLRYDLAATNALSRDYQKIELSVYIGKGVGVCRTQAALSTYLIEHLIKQGELNGRISIDRNKDHDVVGGHAWARFTDESEQVFIIDPAQKFVGTLEATKNIPKGWDYRRTEDLLNKLP